LAKPIGVILSNVDVFLFGLNCSNATKRQVEIKPMSVFFRRNKTDVSSQSRRVSTKADFRLIGFVG